MFNVPRDRLVYPGYVVTSSTHRIDAGKAKKEAALKSGVAIIVDVHLNFQRRLFISTSDR